MLDSLRSLSDQEVLSRTLEITRRERAVTLQVLLHLNEIERRKLHLRQGYSSMFDYCTRGLHYSESAANLRIRAARCITRFPEVARLLDSGAVNLSTISQASRVLRADNAEALLARISGRSQREVEAIVAGYDLKQSLPGDRLRTVVVRIPAVAANTTGTLVVAPVEETAAPRRPIVNEAAPMARTDASPVTRAETSPAIAASPGTRDWQEIYRCNSGNAGHAMATRKVFTFSASETFAKKFERMKSLVCHRFRAGSTFEQIFELAVDSFLEKHDPVARENRRRERRSGGKARKHAVGPTPNHPRGNHPEQKRHIPAAVRDFIFLRDQGRCTYRSTDGRRCSATHVLQIDHVVPVARGGTSAPGNLRLLCAYHNRLECERLMGPAERRRKLTLGACGR